MGPHKVQAIFFRMSFKAGISEARKLATPNDVQYIMDQGYKQLEMRLERENALRSCVTPGYLSGR